MFALESRLDRLPLLGKWFVRIVPLCGGVFISLEWPYPYRPGLGAPTPLSDFTVRPVTDRRWSRKSFPIR
jgi:hypothetical protein